MNRFKLLLLLFLAIAFGVLCFQNRQPLSLKLLCPDTASSCWYRTASLPLALWIALFVLAGVLSSLIWQSLNSYAYASKRKSRDAASFPEESSTPERFTTRSTFPNSTEVENTANSTTSYEIEREREPETVRRSGSTYSYKFKDKSDRTDESTDKKNDNQKSEDDEDWI